MASVISSQILFSLSITLAAVATTAAEGGGGVVAPRELWCVAKNNADDAALQSAIDWACGPGGADCGPIQSGGPCYDTADLLRTASYAFNDYFIKHGNDAVADSCSFSNTAALTSLNPSHGHCKFRSSSSASNGNFSGSSMAGSDTADLTSTSSSSITRCPWLDRGSILVLLFTIARLV